MAGQMDYRYAGDYRGRFRAILISIGRLTILFLRRSLFYGAMLAQSRQARRVPASMRPRRIVAYLSR